MQALVTRVIPQVTLGQMVAGAWRPLVATAAMVPAVLGLEMVVGSGSTFGLLAGKVLVGVATYSVVALMLWLASGKPEGAEAYFTRKIASALVAWRRA